MAPSIARIVAPTPTARGREGRYIKSKSAPAITANASAQAVVTA